MWQLDKSLNQTLTFSKTSNEIFTYLQDNSCKKIEIEEGRIVEASVCNDENYCNAASLIRVLRIDTGCTNDLFYFAM